MKHLLFLSKENLIKKLWSADPKIFKILSNSRTLDNARKRLFEHLDDLEKVYFNIYDKSHLKNAHIIEKNNAKECIKVLKNVIRTENEYLSKFSALDILWKISKKS